MSLPQVLGGCCGGGCWGRQWGGGCWGGRWVLGRAVGAGAGSGWPGRPHVTLLQPPLRCREGRGWDQPLSWGSACWAAWPCTPRCKVSPLPAPSPLPWPFVHATHPPPVAHHPPRLAAYPPQLPTRPGDGDPRNTGAGAQPPQMGVSSGPSPPSTPPPELLPTGSRLQPGAAGRGGGGGHSKSPNTPPRPKQGCRRTSAPGAGWTSGDTATGTSGRSSPGGRQR